jgi:hypothetical protein
MIFKNHETLGTKFPKIWEEKVELSFQDTFNKDKDLTNAFYRAFGSINQNEILTAIGLTCLSGNDPLNFSIFVSKEVTEEQMNRPKDLSTLKNDMVDILGVLFNEVLKEKEDIPFSARWEQYTFKRQEYYYRISRENLELYLKAQELLLKK